MESTAIVQIQNSDPGDERLIELWGKRHAPNTAKYYVPDAHEFLSYVGKSIREVTIYDLQAYEESLSALKPGSQARKINSVKSLLSYAHKVGYAPFNVGAAHTAPKVRSELAQRILSEEQTIRLIDATRDNQRNHALLRLMYHCGLRVSEVCNITWSDLVERSEGGQVSIWGKGGKERNVLISGSMWAEVQALRGDSGLSDYVFQSRKGATKLTERQVERIVLDAAQRAGIQGAVSPHWLRHAHASHSLDRGANINLVRDTLGHASLATTGKYTHARPNASSSQYLPL